MVRERVLLPLLAAVALLVVVGLPCFVLPLAFEVPCHEPGPEDGGGLIGFGSSPAPGPGSGGGGARVCLRVSFAAVLAFCFVAGALTGSASTLCYVWFADGGEVEDEAAGAAKKAGYVAIAGDLEVAGVKN